MDDQTFDQKSAQEWINIIEGPKSPREIDIYPRLKTWINHVSPSEILEIGSGQGICSDKIDLDGRNYTGVEPSLFLVERAKQLYLCKNRNFLLGSAYSLPFSDNIFDAAFSVTVWHLLNDIKKAADELSRVLKPDGHFLIITANPGAYSMWTDGYTDTKLDGRRFEGKVRLQDQSISHDVLYLHTLDEIIDSLQSAHLKIKETETFRISEKHQGREQFISIQGQRLTAKQIPRIQVESSSKSEKNHDVIF